MSAALHPSCDRSIAESKAATALPGDAARGILATTILASSLAFIDGSIVNVGLPAIGKSLGADGESLAWVINGYLLPLSALLLLGGAAGDLFGRRRLLMLGIALFAAASVLCALAPGVAWLLAGRLLQGIGAAMLMPNSLAILGASFSGEARGKAIGTWAAVGAAGGAIGPLLGGWLIDVVGWRAMFFVNLPIAAAAVWLASKYVRDEAPPTPAPRLDLAGAVLATAGLAALTLGLTVASGPAGFSASALGGLMLGVALLGLFVRAEGRRGDQAMLPLALFSSARFVGLTLLTFLLYAALGGVLVLIPYVLIDVKGYSATAAGAALLPLPAVIALLSPTMGRISAKVGPRLPLAIGPVVVALGFLLAMRIGGAGSYLTTTLPATLVISLGMAGAVAPLTTAVLASVEPNHTGVASGFNSAVARGGGLVATALLGTVLAAHGPALEALYRIAVMVGAGAALAAGLCAWRWVRAD
jgi:EmrB/QacA subfamily drug resistance transporter